MVNSTCSLKCTSSWVAEIILTEVSDKVNPNMQPLSKLLDADNLVIFRKKKPKNIPSMTKKEFMEFEEANELVKFLKEF